jgi:hypothetical protein
MVKVEGENQASELMLSRSQKEVLFCVLRDYLYGSHATEREVKGELPDFELRKVSAIREIMPKLAADTDYNSSRTSPLELVFMGLDSLVSDERLEKILEDSEESENREEELARDTAKYFLEKRKGKEE